VFCGVERKRREEKRAAACARASSRSLAPFAFLPYLVLRAHPLQRRGPRLGRDGLLVCVFGWFGWEEGEAGQKGFRDDDWEEDMACLRGAPALEAQRSCSVRWGDGHREPSEQGRESKAVARLTMKREKNALSPA
jgi:hypothetical protein